MGCAVRRNKAVAAEVLIVGVHPSTEVATIAPVVSAIVAYGINTLVNPVPDKATLHMGVSLHNVEILAEVTRRVTHSVGKLAHNIWLGRVLSFGIALHIGNRGVHRAGDVGVRATIGLLKLHGTALVALLNPLVCLGIYLAIATLVAHRPDDYRGVVLVALNHRAYAVVVRTLPLFAV